jgi:hypothetical protein
VKYRSYIIDIHICNRGHLDPTINKTPNKYKDTIYTGDPAPSENMVKRDRLNIGKGAGILLRAGNGAETLLLAEGLRLVATLAAAGGVLVAAAGFAGEDVREAGTGLVGHGGGLVGTAYVGGLGDLLELNYVLGKKSV